MNIQFQVSFQRYISIKLSFYNKIELNLKKYSIYIQTEK